MTGIVIDAFLLQISGFGHATSDKLLQDGPKEWESDGKFGRCWSDAMGMFDAMDCVLQAAMVETIKVEAKINMPGSQGIELVLDAMEGAGPSQVADPLSEEQVGGWER